MHVATLQAFSWLTTYPLMTVPYLVTSYSAPASFPFFAPMKNGTVSFPGSGKTSYGRNVKEEFRLFAERQPSVQQNQRPA